MLFKFAASRAAALRPARPLTPRTRRCRRGGWRARPKKRRVGETLAFGARFASSSRANARRTRCARHLSKVHVAWCVQQRRATSPRGRRRPGLPRHASPPSLHLRGHSAAWRQPGAPTAVGRRCANCTAGHELQCTPGIHRRNRHHAAARSHGRQSRCAASRNRHRACCARVCVPCASLRSRPLLHAWSRLLPCTAGRHADAAVRSSRGRRMGCASRRPGASVAMIVVMLASFESERGMLVACGAGPALPL